MKYLLALLALSLPAQQINVGGPTTEEFQSDRYYTGGTAYRGTVPAGVPSYYATQRYGNFAYSVPVAAGEYDVALHFYELTSTITGPGQRRFRIAINGADVLPDFDIWASGGRGPVVKRFRVTATDAIRIEVATILRNGALNAVEIRRVPTVVVTATRMDRLPNGNYPPCAGRIERNGLPQYPWSRDIWVAPNGEIVAQWEEEDVVACIRYEVK